MNNEQSTPYRGTGYLVLRVTTARGAIPLEDALVTIRGAEPETSGILAAYRSNRDGRTPRHPLPTPLREESESPGESKPYAAYDVDVWRKGYIPQTYRNVPIFDGITAVQPADLIPLPATSSGSGNTPYDESPLVFDEQSENNL